MKENEPDQAFVQRGQHILIQMPSGNVKMVNLKPKTQISLGKFGSFLSDNLIGQPFGLSYEIYTNKGDIRPVSHSGVNTAVEETSANNQMIIDDSSIQKLSHEEVLALKEQGLQGTMAAEEIIKKMVDSHGGFDKKTEYSKAKYIERKKKKFNKIFIPIRPTLRTMCEYFFNKNPDKIKHLRIDTLSQLLSMANIRAHSKLLVVDDTQGMIITAIMERMGGFGTIVGVHEGDNHNYDVMRYMNFPEKMLSTLHTVPFDMVDPETPNDHFDIKTEEEIKDMSEDSRRNYLRRKKAFDIKTTARRLLFEGDFDG
ncbi:eukaryotic initiation factor 3, gamma subunit [Backusella circina FSU 941]|nr:eukaryotic initiation factor 3, gamma subunit [Backusella circina FSU 941]KAI8884940.1 eukaryotic initiation factor 3, gamma subunit [Backusella circina FSU 941]